MNEKQLQKNFDYVNKNRDELLKTYSEKYIIVFEEKVVGAFDNYGKAVEEAIRMLGEEADFLVHHLTKVESVNFLMRAAF